MKNLIKNQTKEEKIIKVIATGIAIPISLVLSIIYYVAKFTYKVSYRFKRLLVKVSVMVWIVYSAYTTLLVPVYAPKPVHAYSDKIVTPTPILSVYQQHRNYILSQTHSDILLRIWENETGQGKYTGGANNLQVYCANRHESNEFGFNPYNHECFKTFNQSVDTVNAWWTHCLASNSLSACLDIYSGNSYSYISKFLNQ